MRYLTVTFTAIIILAVSTSLSYAVVYPFNIFTSTTGFGFGGPNEDDPRINLYVEVFNDNETAAFRFCNQSSLGDPDLLDLSIIAIYFDNETFLEAPQITNQTGCTNFLEGANPPELQTDEIIDFQTTDSFSADSDGSDIAENGINPGEWLTINFNLWPGASIEDVINQINNANLRIGIRVMFLPDGENESAVNVPEPAAIVLLTLGTLLMLRKRRPDHKK
jgi:hypothetical protein